MINALYVVYLEKPAFCSPEGHHSHLAGQACDLFNQEGQLGGPGLPVFHLHCWAIVIPLYSKLL